jgi:hypothetical protein
MTKVRLPDGSIEIFPDDMSHAVIEAILRKRFPPPRPKSLEPGERAWRGNGAEVTFSPVMQRYVVYDAAGTARGFRTSLDAAIDLADAILPPPQPRTKPEQQPAPKRVDVGVAAEGQIAADIESHIRRSEGQARRHRRFEIVEHKRGRRRAV